MQPAAELKARFTGVLRRHRRAAPSPWQVLTPIIALIAGLLFAISSQTARGSDLRSDREEITQVIRARVLDIRALEEQRKQLAGQVDSLAAAAAQNDNTIAAIEQQSEQAAPYAGLTPVHGPGVKVTITDAPLGPNGELPAGARPDDVIIHQSDVQGILNAMWSAGADAVMVQGQRIINTTAVRCVGNTLLLLGETYSPPFEIVAIGNQDAIEQALATAPGTQLFLNAVDVFGLGYDVQLLDDVDLPAYDGSLGISHAKVLGD
ncbi:DUF881 domain-containing protein [Cumulibacter soli]|uniref:DUF881 domain-containing protein n=1 Tax=Cumulibacter soli TaxID=2546344 RepID=UPI0010688FBF|nr:DUF881 domain-containing protein [Cumulibacter soli]